MSYFQQFRLDANWFLKTTFCAEERGVFFESTKWVYGIIETLRTSSNKSGWGGVIKYDHQTRKLAAIISPSLEFQVTPSSRLPISRVLSLPILPLRWFLFFFLLDVGCWTFIFLSPNPPIPQSCFLSHSHLLIYPTSVNLPLHDIW